MPFDTSTNKQKTPVVSLPDWVQLIQTKEKHVPFYQKYKGAIPGDARFITHLGDLQEFLLCVPYVFGFKHKVKKLAKPVKFKKLSGLQDAEAVFTLVLQTILMSLDPKYSSSDVDECLEMFGKGIEPSPLRLSKEVVDESPFAKESLDRILQDKRFQVAIQLLKFKLNEEKGWTSKVESRDDNIMAWINSVFEPSTSKAILQVAKSSAMPTPIVFDALLRRPANELEYLALFGLYKKSSVDVNLKDQEKLYYLKQTAQQDQTLFIDRNVLLPPAFGNLFSYALRYKVETLPQLIELFLDKNNAQSPQIMDQLSEIIWQLSYDHSGKNTVKPSRHYKVSQSKMIRAINSLTRKHGVELGVTTLLGVSTLAFFSDYRKSYNLFKEGKKSFHRWQLKSFDIDGFEKVVTTDDNTNAFTQPGVTGIDEMRLIRKDYNIKFLCNSIMLLQVDDSNQKEMVYRDIVGMLARSDPELLKVYPELWDFVLAKLNYHSMLTPSKCRELFDLYMKKYDGEVVNRSALDLLINNADDRRLLVDMLNTIKMDQLDDLSLSRFIAKLYKISKVYKPQSEMDAETASVEDGSNDDETLKPLLKHYRQVVRPQKYARAQDAAARADREVKFDALGFQDPVALARHLYEGAPFKSSRLNSSHLLGESIFSPAETYNRYMAMDRFTKNTPVTISALFVSILRLKELGLYEETKWNDTDPMDVALSEFDEHVCVSYGNFLDGRFYPDNNLLSVYLQANHDLRRNDRLYSFLDKMVDLHYSVHLGLFQLYLSLLPPFESQELVESLNAFAHRFETLRECESEYELNRMKRQLPPVEAGGRFKEFVGKLGFNWDIVRDWQWPGKP